MWVGTCYKCFRMHVSLFLCFSEMHQEEVSRGLASIINARPFADLLLVYVE